MADISEYQQYIEMLGDKIQTEEIKMYPEQKNVIKLWQQRTGLSFEEAAMNILDYGIASIGDALTDRSTRMN
ncbi:hypothetical protein SAMN05443144_102100 [Fodinibius roseus]|uniref:Uncharacterized protein n=1 Tax=Fodinibius roseus TaxID=1194090 RepID=A0A1M4UQE0_9BACT|nr:hypothetical protein [Fodinibius roseus]SHE58924.1 hypothetical protein SAMN05443144_102100 [Fodinibius roseus]